MYSKQQGAHVVYNSALLYANNYIDTYHFRGGSMNVVPLCHVTAPAQYPYLDPDLIPCLHTVPAHWHTTKIKHVMLIQNA